MVGQREQKSAVEAGKLRLETPRLSGYRSGMSTTGLIGRRLARIYDVAAELPRDMGALLTNLDGKTGGTR